MALTYSLFRISIVLLLSVLLCCCSGTFAPAEGTSPVARGVLQRTAEGAPIPPLTDAPAPTPSFAPLLIPTRVPSLTHRPTSRPERTSTPSPTPGGLEGESRDRTAPVYTYSIVHVYPHDPGAFTQGLVYDQGVLYEGTGLRGRSTLRRVELETGAILQLRALPDQYFGEGITLYRDELLQLTWKSNTGFVYDRDSMQLLGTFHYRTEGWGLTHDGQQLIMSDGTATLHFLDPETFERVGHITVHDGNMPVLRLNELEYVQGEIYANVWQTDLVARIDPGTGTVVSWIDLTGLLESGGYTETRPIDVLNGIAYDVQNDRLFVTGKLWPKLYEIELLAPHQIFLPCVVCTTATTTFPDF